MSQDKMEWNKPLAPKSYEHVQDDGQLNSKVLEEKSTLAQESSKSTRQQNKRAEENV